MPFFKLTFFKFLFHSSTDLCNYDLMFILIHILKSFWKWVPVGIRLIKVKILKELIKINQMAGGLNKIGVAPNKAGIKIIKPNMLLKDLHGLVKVHKVVGQYNKIGGAVVPRKLTKILINQILNGDGECRIKNTALDLDLLFKLSNKPIANLGTSTQDGGLLHKKIRFPLLPHSISKFSHNHPNSPPSNLIHDCLPRE